MNKLLILSGKGGTGKTTTSAAFIYFAQARAFADCDVDAPNLHLVQSVEGEPEAFDYLGSEKASIDPELCTGCGACADACRFGAIRKDGDHCRVDPYACEGCGVCAYVCPQKAVELHEDVAGQVLLYQGEQTFSTAHLRTGRGNSGKLVSEVKLALFKHAPEADLAILDGSPGIGCPVISSISGADLVLVVTEPSLSGLSDLERVLRIGAMAGVDLITFDAAGGGSGYSPCHMMNEWGLPAPCLADQLVSLSRKLRSQGLVLPAIALTGGFATEDQVFKALAFGEGCISAIGLCRASMAAAMTGKKIGDEVKAGNVPELFKPYGSTVEELFGDLPDLRALYGKEANNFSTGAVGVFSYLNKIAFGLRHFAALNRKFKVGSLDRSDLIPLTRDAKDLLSGQW